jgi:hypothetical protein
MVFFSIPSKANHSSGCTYSRSRLLDGLETCHAFSKRWSKEALVGLPVFSLCTFRTIRVSCAQFGEGVGILQYEWILFRVFVIQNPCREASNAGFTSKGSDLLEVPREHGYQFICVSVDTATI